jgi:hypothetical protein
MLRSRQWLRTRCFRRRITCSLTSGHTTSSPDVSAFDVCAPVCPRPSPNRRLAVSAARPAESRSTRQCPHPSGERSLVRALLVPTTWVAPFPGPERGATGQQIRRNAATVATQWAGTLLSVAVRRPHQNDRVGPMPAFSWSNLYSSRSRGFWRYRGAFARRGTCRPPTG